MTRLAWQRAAWHLCGVSSKRTRWILIGVVVAAVAAVVTMVSMRRGSVADVERLWSEADLPTLPPTASNGWQVVVDARAQLPVDYPTENLAEVSALLADPDTVWSELEARDATMSPIIAAFKRSAYRDVWHRARALPTFADACAWVAMADCPTIMLVQLHRIAVLDFLLDARGEHWDEALEGMHRLLQIELDFQASARDVVAQVAAAEMLADGMSATVALVTRAGAQGQQPQLRAKLLELASTAEFGPHLDRAVVAHYLRTMVGLEQLAAAQATAGVPGDLATWLFSPAKTGAELNRYFRVLMKVVTDEAGRPEPADAQACQLRFDPAGCQLLEIAATVHQLRDHRDQVLRALARVEAAQAKLPVDAD